MKKLFISYCTKNQELVEKFIEFIQLGMGVKKEDIFCTADLELLVTGENFIEKIRRELQECDTVISIITEEYLKSKFCLVEMGAAWVMSKRYFPLLTVPYERLNETPLQGVQMRKLEREADLCVVYDELQRCGVLKKHQTAEFYKRLPIFVRDVICETNLLQKDSEGYYEAIISSIRPVLKTEYRCFGIQGQIADWPDRETSNSDWLFGIHTKFPELKVGDKVRFKVLGTKMHSFPDLGNARNIYPEDLKKIQ